MGLISTVVDLANVIDVVVTETQTPKLIAK